MKQVTQWLSKLTKYDYALGAVGLFHLVSNIIWMTLSTAPVPWDQSGHTKLAIYFAHYFRYFHPTHILDFFSISTYYPPLIHVLISIPIIFFGHPVIISEFIITLFFLMSLVFLYLYATELTGSRGTGLLAATLYSFFPIAVEHSHWFLLETPLMALLLATLYFLQKSKAFTNTHYTRLFLVFAGLALITKWLAAVALAIPVLIALYQAWKKNRTFFIKKEFLKGIGIFLLIALPWYLINLRYFFPQVAPNLAPHINNPHGLTNFQNDIFYTYIFMNFQLALWYSLLFFGSVIYYVAKQRPHRLLIFGSMALVYLVFTIIPNKDWRYTMALTPFAAVVIADCLMALMRFKKVLGTLLITLALVYGISLTTLLSFRNAFHLQIQRAIPLPIIGYVDYINLNDNLVHSYNQTTWRQKDILKTIQNDLHKQGKDTTYSWVLSLVDQERLNGGNLLLEKEIEHLDYIQVDLPPDTKIPTDKLHDYLSKYDYAVFPVVHVGVEATRNIDVYKQLIKAIQDERRNPFIKTYKLPNNDLLLVYRIYHD